MVTKLATPTHIAVLAPGQEWRAVWFSAVKWEEYDGELRKLYEGNVTFTDTRTPIPGKKPYDNPISLNVQTFRNTMRLKEIEPARLVAEQIAAVAATLDSYHKDDSGIWVYTLSGDEERQRREQEDKEQYAAWKQGYDELTRSMWPDSEPEEPNPDETSNEAEPQ